MNPPLQRTLQQNESAFQSGFLGCFFAFIFVVCLSAGTSTAFAQEQESRWNKVLDPDSKTSSFGAQKKAPFEAKAFQGSRSALVKDFQYKDKAQTKSFRTSKFKGEKEMRLNTYDTKVADTNGRGMTAKIVKDYETKDHKVKTDRDAGKDYSVATYKTKETKWRGSSQDLMDKEGPAAMASVQRDGSFRKLETIDDIRDLLNKLD